MSEYPKTPEQYFADWEGYVFGFGYGSGEPHTVPALRAFLELCDEGERGHCYDFRRLEAALTPPVAWLLINALCRYGVDIIEYGTSPRFAWLTPEGERLKAFMLSKPTEELIALAATNDDPCYPNACNCGPDGYDPARVCQNPFWRRHPKPVVGRGA